MADSVAEALETGQHLLVQAGTGTGKSLGYLAPALTRVVNHPDERVVVATATLALQAQLASKDIPSALDAVEQATGRRPRAAILKGRSNYACLLRVREGVADQDTLLGSGEVVEALRATAQSPESVVGAEVVALREWAEDELTEGNLADRDDAPTHGTKAWAQVSVPVRECLGAQRCPFGEECFVEKSRERARESDLVVTNHALLAIDAMHGGTALPEHDHVIIDEAHELVSRVTGAASVEMSPQQIERVGRRATAWLDDDLGLELLDLSDALNDALLAVAPERVTEPDSPVVRACEQIREVTRRVLSSMNTKDAENDQRQAAAAVKEVYDVAERAAALADADVVYVNDRGERFGRELRVSPLSVAGLMRERVLGEATTVLTSATLTIGGEFGQAAGSVGLSSRERREHPEPAGAEVTWRGVDVGSPFDYRRQGILYVGRTLPPPRRDGIADEVLTEVAELVWAAGGRTLGLFASQRSAELAATHARKQLPKQTILCQGDAQLSELTRRFIAEPDTSLFGTVSLWQGIDVPGDTCELVIIDKIPFPRPDDPLMQARQKAVAEAGGNGFMAIAAGHAALLMAQGAGRLIRRASDRGVVAVLDPRLVTARYGSFLRASMPDMWMTTDREVAVGALRRLQESRAD
ncbi:ATP-dependent DNA helicase [Mariniluteicoccus endophyticus]